MNYYLVDGDGVIVNSVVVDDVTIESGWTPPDHLTLVAYDGEAAIGWLWDGKKAVNPNPEPDVQLAEAGTNVIA